MAPTPIAEIAFRLFLWRSRDERPNEVIDEGDHDDKEEDHLSLEREEGVGKTWNSHEREPGFPAVLLQAKPIFKTTQKSRCCLLPQKVPFYTANSYCTSLSTSASFNVPAPWTRGRTITPFQLCYFPPVMKSPV